MIELFGFVTISVFVIILPEAFSWIDSIPAQFQRDHWTNFVATVDRELAG